MCLLKALVRRPGLELRETAFTNEDGDESTLLEQHIEELKAVDSSSRTMDRTGMVRQSSSASLI